MHFLLLVAVFCTNALTLYIIFKTHSDKRFDIVIQGAVSVLLFHSFYAFLAHYCYADQVFVDRGAPFGLLYGPILYFMAFANHDVRFRNKNILFHLAPFLLATVCYVVFLWNTALRREYEACYLGILYSGKSLSMLGYVLFVFLNQKKTIPDSHFRKLINSGATWLILVASLFASVLISKIAKQKELDTMLPSIMVYVSMLFVSLLIFKYTIRTILIAMPVSDDDVDIPETQLQSVVTGQYKKSALTTVILKEYELKLNEIMLHEQLFLDTELSLDGLSKKVKIPKHHLTQLFNTRINQSFYQYVNTHRVNYSCMLLREEPETNLEEIAFKSGFNSKVSFNRHFKNQMHCTPSEYRQL